MIVASIYCHKIVMREKNVMKTNIHCQWILIEKEKRINFLKKLIPVSYFKNLTWNKIELKLMIKHLNLNMISRKSSSFKCLRLKWREDKKVENRKQWKEKEARNQKVQKEKVEWINNTKALSRNNRKSLVHQVENNLKVWLGPSPKLTIVRVKKLLITWFLIIQDRLNPILIRIHHICN